MDTAATIVLIICITVVLVNGISAYTSLKKQNSNTLRQINSDIEWLRIDQASNSNQLSQVSAQLSELRKELQKILTPNQQSK